MTSAPHRRGPAWWEFLLVAPCLIALVVVGGGLGLDAWFVGMWLVLLAALCGTAGVVLGLATLVRRSRPARG